MREKYFVTDKYPEYRCSYLYILDYSKLKKDIVEDIKVGIKCVMD